MARNGHLRAKKRKRAYQPRSVMALGGLQIIINRHAAAEDASPLVEDDRKTLNLAYHLAMDAMTRGAGSEELWSTIVVTLNVALILTERDIGKEYEADLIRALDGAFRAKIRAGRIGTWGFDGDAITGIRHALAIHDEQIKVITKAEARDALQEVYNRITNGNIYREAA